MYQALSGIPPVFKKLYFNPENIHAIGQFSAERGKGVIGFLLGLPFGINTYGKKKSFGLTIDKHKKKNVWTRLYHTKVFTTKVVNNELSIRERYGIFEFEFNITQRDGLLNFVVKKFKIFKICLPDRISFKSSAVCKALSDSEWTFEVDVKTCTGRPVIRYWGQASILNG